MSRSTRYLRRREQGGIVRTLALVFDGVVVIVALAGIAYVAAYFVPLDDVLPQTRRIPGPTISASFDDCAGQSRQFCVVDGDTLRVNGEKVRVADIDTPEVFSPKCAAERALGDHAARRLTELLNAGPFELGGYDRDEDVYGRKLRILRRDGQSLGETLVAEGLARRWDSPQRDWCA